MVRLWEGMSRGSTEGVSLPVAFGGILFFLLAIVVFAVVVWAVIAYLRGGVEAATDGIDDDPESGEHPDAGHVAGPQGR